MAGRKKREPVTAAPGLTETGASASVLVSGPVIQKDELQVQPEQFSGMDMADQDSDSTIIVLFNRGNRPRYEPVIQKVIPAGGSVRIEREHRDDVAVNVAQINHLAGSEVLSIQEIKE